MIRVAIDYAPPRYFNKRWAFARRFLPVAAVCLAFIGLSAVTGREVERRIDTVTGTMTSKTTWAFGIPSAPAVDTSPLELHLKQRNIPWMPNSRFLHSTQYDGFGRATRRACATAPPIYSFRPILGDFAVASTDEELREFVRVMQSGTEAEQRATLEAAAESVVTKLTRR